MQDKDQKKYVNNLIIYDINMEYYKKIWYDDNKKEIENLNKNSEFRVYMTKEMDEQFIHNTEMKQALNEGIEIGEKNTKLELALNMLNKNLDINLIMECTEFIKK